MDIPISQIFNSMRHNGLHAAAGMMKPTEQSTQSIYWDASNNHRFIIEYTDEVLIIYYIPQTIIIPTPNQVKNFESITTTIDFKSDEKVNIFINNILPIQSIYRDLLDAAISLVINKKGKVIAFK
ncbi:hypothetical protein ACX1G6_12640 [Yersinia enterocolitica]